MRCLDVVSSTDPSRVWKSRILPKDLKKPTEDLTAKTPLIKIANPIVSSEKIMRSNTPSSSAQIALPEKVATECPHPPGGTVT